MNRKPFNKMISDIFCKKNAPYKEEIIPRPLHEVIHDICCKKVIRFKKNNQQDKDLKKAIERACMDTYKDLKKKPVVAKRPNEAGNKIEAQVRKALKNLKGYTASSPCGKSAGYPDILLKEQDDRYTYIECKTYHKDNIKQTLRSFYLSPSETFKVEYDARHLVVAFEVHKTRWGKYRAAGFKIIDAYSLPCKLKLEWNSDNKSLYELSPLGQYHEQKVGMVGTIFGMLWKINPINR